LSYYQKTNTSLLASVVVIISGVQIKNKFKEKKIFFKLQNVEYKKKMILYKSSVKCKVINILDAKKKNKKTKTKLQNTSLSSFEKKIKKIQFFYHYSEFF